MAFETFPRISSNESERSRHKLENDFFHELIATKIVDSYDVELEKHGYDDELINNFNEKVLTLTPLDRESLYAFPWELKQRALPMFLKKIQEGQETIETMVEKVIEISKKQHRRIAYHTSNENIVPEKRTTGAVAALSWQVNGTEQDHRDNDLPMAYYSYDYENLYRVKNPRYMYIVSVQEYEGSGHKKDGNYQWGRAPTLPIVEKVDFHELGKTIQELTDEEIKNDQK